MPSYATHVRLISLPLLMKTSLFPNISARETVNDKEEDIENIIYEIEINLLAIASILMRPGSGRRENGYLYVLINFSL